MPVDSMSPTTAKNKPDEIFGLNFGFEWNDEIKHKCAVWLIQGLCEITLMNIKGIILDLGTDEVEKKKGGSLKWHRNTYFQSDAKWIW